MLIALLIMSIGLVSVAVMFPLSVVRSIKASQLTNSTDTRYAAESMIAVYPNMIKDPGYYGNPAGYTTPFIVDPLGFVEASQINPTLATYFGNNPAGGNPLPYPPLDPTKNSPTINPWTLRRYPFFFPAFSPAPANQNLGIFPNGAGTQPTEASADAIVTSPDSWLLQYDGIPNSFQVDPQAPLPAGGATQVNVPGLWASGFRMPVSPGGVVSAPQARIVMFSSDGLTSQTRFITSVGQIVSATDTNDTVKWTEDIDNSGTYTAAKDINGNGILDAYQLPTTFVPGGTVRIEIQERRYTWLLTVRKDEAGNTTGVDVVVFFKRPFDTIFTDETLYPTFPPQIVGGGAPPWGFTAGNPTVMVNYQGMTKPFMHKGNYVFDANNAFWYRISNVVDNSPAVGQATLTLEAPANANGPTGAPGFAMFPRAVVDVYPIGPK